MKNIALTCAVAIAACAGPSTRPVADNTRATAELPRERRATLQTDGSIATSGAYSRSGRHVAIAGATKEVRVWDVSTGTLVAKRPSLGTKVIAGADEDAFIVLDDSQPTITIWNWRDSTHRTIAVLDQLAASDATASMHDASSISQIALSPDGTLLLSVHDLASAIVVWDLARGTPRRLLEGGASTVAFLPDGTHALSVGKQLAMLDLTAGTRTVLYETDVAYDDAVISADGRRLIAARAFGDSAGSASRLDIFALPDGKLVRSIDVESTVWQFAHANLALTADGTKLLVTVSGPRSNARLTSSAILFDLTTGQRVRTFTEVLSSLRDDPTTLANALALAPDGTSLVVMYRDIALY